jgi:RimJ/RimL family protein N-acetyltransferase
VDVTLHRWSPDDHSVLERANTPEMTRFLGGPETPEKLLERHERYLQHWESGHAHMFRIDVDGVPAGSIGWWRVEHKGRPAYETGWGIEPEWQGRGIARLALRRLIADVRADGERALLVAYPGVDNAGSNALCRGAGFEHTGSETAPWRGGELTFNIWELDMSPLDLAGREPDVDERFDGGDLDLQRWWPFYTPHWSSRERAAARFDLDREGLTLRIDEDTAPWAPDLDGDLRVSHLQTGQRSGPVGSEIGQHRFRPGLVVTEQQPEHRGWLVHHGVIEARLAAIRHPAAMVALWPIGFEEQPDDCGEICIAEIFGSEVDDAGGWVGIGIKPQNDPRLREDFEKVWVAGDLTAFHDYAVEWTSERVRFFIDGQWVKTVAQSIDYPVQLMLDVYEFPAESARRDAVALPHRFRVAHVRTYAARR